MPFAVSPFKSLKLRRAWLSLLDKRITAGRINLFCILYSFRTFWFKIWVSGSKCYHYVQPVLNVPVLFQSATLAHINNTYYCTNVQQYNTILTSLAPQWALCSKIASTTIPDTHYHPKSVLRSAVPFVKSLELRICSRKHLNSWINHQIQVNNYKISPKAKAIFPVCNTTKTLASIANYTHKTRSPSEPKNWFKCTPKSNQSTFWSNYTPKCNQTRLMNRLAGRNEL